MKKVKSTLPADIEWRWGSIEKIIIYTITGILFISSMCIDINNRWNKKTDNTDILVVGLSFIGFLFLLLFQIKNKWIYGVIAISLITLINGLITYKLYENLNIK